LPCEQWQDRVLGGCGEKKIPVKRGSGEFADLLRDPRLDPGARAAYEQPLFRTTEIAGREGHQRFAAIRPGFVDAQLLEACEEILRYPKPE
jgi:hypothetical protein